MENNPEDKKMNSKGQDNNDDWRKRFKDELNPEKMEQRVKKFRNGKYRFSFLVFHSGYPCINCIEFSFYADS